MSVCLSATSADITEMRFKCLRPTICADNHYILCSLATGLQLFNLITPNFAQLPTTLSISHKYIRKTGCLQHRDQKCVILRFYVYNM